MEKNLDTLLSDLKSVHPDIKLVSTNLVVVADWVSWKCKYGCPAYGKHLCCPPFTPTSGETRKMISEYSSAIIVRLEVPAGSGREDAKRLASEGKTKLQKIVCDLERQAFLSGYYKAFGMSSSPCYLCESCVIEDKLARIEMISELDAVRCRHKDVMRPSMEACGIDIFKTLDNAGYDTKVLKDYAERLELFGMVLLD